MRCFASSLFLLYSPLAAFLTVLSFYFEVQWGMRELLRGVRGMFCWMCWVAGHAVFSCDSGQGLCCWFSILLRAVTCEKQCSSRKTKFNFSSPSPVKGVLLLQQLTKSNAAIQKIVAFENAFERLLDIITEEGNSDGGTEKSKTYS